MTQASFRLTPKQAEAMRVIGGPAMHDMLEGGSRSGKTFVALRAIAIRALAAPRSRHAALRFRFNHIKASIIYDTFPKMMQLCFSEVWNPQHMNKTDWFYQFPNGSELWFGGLDDKERTEKILGQEYCVDPSAKILTADLRWVRAEDIEVGDELIGFPEDVTGHVKLTPSIVERLNIIEAEKLKVITTRGETIVSANHKAVALRDDRRHRNARLLSWVEAKDLKVGDIVRFTAEPWEVGESREDGWFSGMLDGEGWVSKPARMAGVAQCEGICLDSLKFWLDRNSIPYADRVSSGKHGKRGPCHKLNASGLWASLRMLGIAQPKRLDSRALWDGCRAFTNGGHEAEILAIKPMGIGPVVSMSTSTKTFIADGFLAHNCTIYANEASQIPYASIQMARTRLAQKCAYNLDGQTGTLRLKFLYDCNPPRKSHWTYQLFHKGVDPEGRKPIPNPENYSRLLMNPEDNRQNLPAEYLQELRSMSARRRARFYEGKYTDDTDNALWTLETIDKWRTTDELPDMQRIVVAVDPSGSGDKDNADNDAIGIVVAGLGTDGNGYLLEDLTVKAGPKVWGNIVATAFDRHGADLIVGETNYGGEMVKFVVQTAKPRAPFKKITASRGKAVRAEPISALAEQGKIRHAGVFTELEDELCDFTTNGYMGTDSPNRGDAYVWAFSELFPGMVKPKEETRQREPRQQRRYSGAGAWMG